MSLRDDFKMVKAGFMDSQRHKLLNHIASAISQELEERANIQMSPPTGKMDTPDKISLNLIFQGEVSERDQRAVRETMLKLKNESELVYLLRRRPQQ